MSRNLIIAFVTVGSLIGIVAVAVLLVMKVLQVPRYINSIVASSVPITNEWTELSPEHPMKVVRDFQSVELEIKGAYIKTDHSEDSGLYLPDGTYISPEVRIQDSEGNWRELKGGSYAASPRGAQTDVFEVSLAGFQLEEYKLPKDTTFRSISIRSDEPFTCEKVIWRNYNMK